MTVKEILEMETAKAPAPVLLLFREGIFLKAYETSAYLFHRFVKQYEVKTVYYKNINCSLLSVGFPSRYPDALVEEFDLVREAEPVEGVYRFTSVRFAFSEEEYRQFRESKASFSPVRKASAASLHGTGGPEPEVLRRLQQFNIAGSTPMECMLFLNELKMLLYGQSLQVQ